MNSSELAFCLVLAGRTGEEDLDVFGLLLATADRGLLLAVEEPLEAGCSCRGRGGWAVIAGGPRPHLS